MKGIESWVGGWNALVLVLDRSRHANLSAVNCICVKEISINQIEVSSLAIACGAPLANQMR